MARRIDFYKVKRGDNLASLKYWNDRFEDLDLRIATRENDAQSIDEAVDSLLTVGLARMDETFTPLILEAQSRLNSLAVSFSADSATELTLPVTGTFAIVLSVESAVDYVYTDYVRCRSSANPANEFLAQVVSFDRDTRNLVVTVASSEGTGTHSDWLIRVGTPPEAGHAERTDNPHQVTALQVGAYTEAETDAHIAAAIAALPPITTALIKANNLSDMPNVPLARQNLGLKALAIEDTVGTGMFASNVRATQILAELAADNITLMTPLRTAQQINYRQAGQGDAEQGSDNSKIMTPMRVLDSIKYNIQGVKPNNQSANYTTVLADKQRHIQHPSSDTNARTWTIAANSQVAYAIGDVLTFVNRHNAGIITITINNDTLRLGGEGTTGNRTLAADGIATAMKVDTTEWMITGVGLT